MYHLSSYLALARVISCWLLWTLSSWVILAISPMSTSCPRECNSSSGFFGMERSWLGTVAFLGRAGEDAKVRVNPWFGVIRPSAYLPVSGSGVVCTGRNSPPAEDCDRRVEERNSCWCWWCCSLPGQGEPPTVRPGPGE